MSTQKQVLVQLKNVTKRYSEAERQRTVLDDVSIEFFRGEFAVLLGPSGSGKSTLLNLMSGVDKIDSGQIFIDGVSVTELSEQQRTLFRRDHIGIVFQSYNLIPTLTVIENVSLPYELQGKSRKEALERARHILEKVGLGERLDSYPDRLSGGQQQRVAIARAVNHEPQLVLADEPTGNLDQKTGEDVLRLLLEMTRDAGKTLIMATHSMEIIPHTDRIFRLDNSKLVEDTQRLKRGAELRAEMESRMNDHLPEAISQLKTR